MNKSLALKRYLERHIEPELPDAPHNGANHWQQVLVIPAYDESPALLQTLEQLSGSGKILLILVLNRPDSNPDTTVNDPLRTAVAHLDKVPEATSKNLPLFRLNNSVDIFCYDLEVVKGPSPSAQGVGLARKIGCDIALLWQSQGAISSEWIYCSDADALLPEDYFHRINMADNSVAAVFPFAHTPGDSNEVNSATALYELKLHQYVLGLAHAQSPYAYHTLGSCIVVKRNNYAQVRGYPKRSGGEDFYLLNKLAKLGSISSLSGDCIAIASRTSHRVPFGTGPAIEKIVGENHRAIFYHPQCFDALRAVLAAVPQLATSDPVEFSQALLLQGLDKKLADRAANAVLKLGIAKAITHCRQHGKTEQQFIRQFDQWFDGFKTLKFIHAIRDSSLAMLTLDQLTGVPTTWFPATNEYTDIQTLLVSIRQSAGWSLQQPSLTTTKL